MRRLFRGFWLLAATLSLFQVPSLLAQGNPAALLEGLTAELEAYKPPLDPADAVTLVADTNAALGMATGSTESYKGVPVKLFAARQGLRIANLFYHRHASPHNASSVLAQVQALYATMPEASFLETSAGRRSSDTGSLPADFVPSATSTTADPCPTLPGDWGEYYDEAKNILESAIPAYDPQDGGPMQCDPSDPLGFTWIITPPRSGPGMDKSVRVIKTPPETFSGTIL